MTKSDRPNERPSSETDKLHRPDTGLPVSGRSATVGEIGRELGDLDFEPDDLLASLRPVEPSEPIADVVGAPLDAARLAAPKLPLLNGEAPDRHDNSTGPEPNLLVEQFDTEEVSTRSIQQPAALPAANLPQRAAPVAEAVSPTAFSHPNSSATPASLAGTDNSSPRTEARATVAKQPLVPRPVAPKSAVPQQRGGHPSNRPALSTTARQKVPPPARRPSETLAGNRPAASLAANSDSPIGPNLSAPEAVGIDVDTPQLTTNDEADLLEELVALPPERTTALSFQRERPANEHLREQDLLDAFHEFAVILTQEAQAPRHPQEQSELALLTSELLAMLGQSATSREYLAALAPVSTPATAFQARQLAFVADDLSSYAQHLRSEIRTSVSHESRRHVMALYADTLRLLPDEEVEGRKHLELSLRAFPSDPRFALQRLSSQYADRSPATRLRAANVPESPQLSEAFRHLSAMRTGGAPDTESSHPAGAFMAARHAWQTHDLGQLLEAILALRTHAELHGAASWLHASLTALNPAARPEDSAILDTLVETGDPEAELALLERRLHQHEERPTSVEIFSHSDIAKLSALDRLALGLAADADSDTLRVLCNPIIEIDPSDALARATIENFGLELDLEQIHEPHLARLAMGTAIGGLFGIHESSQPKADETATGSDADQPSQVRRDHEAASQRVSAASRVLARVVPNEPLPKVLRFDDCISQSAPAESAAMLAEIGPELSESELPALLILGSLLAQLAGDTALQVEQLQLALAHEDGFETAYRGLMSAAPESTPIGMLRLVADRLEPSPRRACLELELSRACDDSSSSDERPESIHSHVNLGPLVAVLDATSSNRMRPFLSIPALNDGTSVARDFTDLLDALQHSKEHDESLPERPAGAPRVFDDAQLHALWSALDPTMPPLAFESLGLDADLRNWLRLRQLVTDCPFSLDRVEPEWFSDIERSFASPLLAAWQRLHHVLRGGTEAIFREHLNAAIAVEDTESCLDRLHEAAYLDPHLEPTFGSAEAMRRALERHGKHLASLRLALRHEARHGELHGTSRTAAQLAQQLGDHQRLAHAWLAIASTTYSDDADANFELAIHLDTLIEQLDDPPLWASRRLLDLAQTRSDDQRILDQSNRLRETSTRAIDAATLTLRAAEAASRLEQWDLTGQLIERAVEIYPEHLVALSMRADYLEARGELPLAAAAYDALADAACMPTHKVAAWVQAATLWSERGDGIDSSDRAMAALERAIELDPSHAEANSRLRDQYIARGDIDKLEHLLTRLLLRVDRSADRAQLEFDRARALMELGRVDEAQSGLDRVLSILPENEQALLLSARLHERRSDFEGAEQQWVRLASLKTDEALQIEAFQRLAVLYETFLEQPARAEHAYREILKRRPNDPAAERLVQLLLRLDNRSGAVELLDQLIAAADNPIVARERSLELARILDEIVNDRRRAEEVLDRTRRKWPNDASTIRALAAFYRRGRDVSALSTLLDRSLVESRRALGSGRFETALFEVVACVAELREEVDFANVANATLSALSCRDTEVSGIELSAAEESFADMLAPEVLSLPLRALLRKSGWALCAAHPIDMRAIRAIPLAQGHPELSEHVRTLARGFGLFEINLYLSPALGAACQPTASVPPTLVVGQGFLNLADPLVQDALVLRALRILSANAAALTNTAPVDLWPLLVGYLACYLPQWLPPGVDAQKIAPIRERIQSVLPPQPDRDAPMLAADVAASIGNRASQLGIAVQQWGSRTALLAVGNPLTLLTAIAAASGQQDRLGNNPADRQKWVLRNAEARDLVVFSVSDAYLSARTKARGGTA